MSKYLIDQAHEREQRRNRLLGLRALPETPQAPTTSRPVETSAGLDNLVQQLKANMAPKGVAQTAGPDLKVAPGGVSRASGDGGGAYNSGDGGAGGLGGLLDNLRNLGGKKGADVRDRSATAAYNRAVQRRDNTPGPYAKGEAATQWAQSNIPGLKPGIDASKAMPGTPAAQAYMEQQRGGPGVTAVEKGAATGDRIIPGADIRSVDPRIAEIVGAAAEGLPPGYKIRPTSGVRDAGQGQHTQSKAVDWVIVDPDGKEVPNRGKDTTGLYTELARNAYGYQEKNHPDLTGQFQWGGQFGTSANNPNEPDLMHFDIGGRRGRITEYSRETIGAKLPPSAKAAGPELPAWDKGLPQTDAKTNWPAPSATTPADQIKATPVATGPAAEGGKVTPQLMDAIEKIESSGNPNAVTGQYKGLFQLSDKQFADYGGKGSIFDPTENRRVAELVINDEAKNLSKDLGRAVTPSEIYLAHQQGYGGAAAHLKNPDQPAWKSMASTAEGQEKGEAWAKQAIWGNIPDDAKAKFGSVENVKSGDFVNLWKEKGARLGIPATAEAAQPAGPGSGPLASPADKGSPVATLRDAVAPGTAGTVDVGGGQISPVDSATPSAAAFEKGGAPAVPYHGVGGMYGPEYEASTTSATLSGPDTEALNAIKKPTASAQAVAAPPAATAPPATPGAVAAPPSQPPGTAAAPPPPAPVRTAAPPPAPPRAATPPLTPAQVAKPLSGYDKARAMVDQPLRQILSPEELKQVPESYQGQTPRQIYNTPLVGGIAMTKMEPLFKQKGFTRDDAMKALSTPPDQPGKRSDAGTSSGLLDKAQGMAATERGAPGPQYAQADTGVRSDAAPGPAPQSATDFSSRGRTPMAPPGLDKVPLPQPGPRTENRNAAQVEMNLTPQERALYDRHIDNLNGPGGVDNPDGSRSSLYQTVEEHDGKFYNVPTVWDGKIQTEKWTDPKSGKTFDIPNKTALDNINKTGWDKFPAYATPEQADARYEQMHGYMDKDTGAYLAGRGQPQAPQQPQQPQSAAPQITPEMAKAIENAVKIDSGPPVVAQPDAQPVLTSSQPGDAGAGLSLAPSGLQNLPAGLAAPGAGPMQSAFMPGSQGGGIAMLGVQPQTGVFSTPLLDSAVQQPAGSFAAGSLSPIAPQFMGWGGGFGGTSGGSGFGGMYGDSMLGSEVGMGNTMGSMFGSG